MKKRNRIVVWTSHVAASVVVVLLCQEIRGDENFKSMKELRENYKGSGEYGVSEKLLLWFKDDKAPVTVECRFYLTETAIDDRYAFSSGAIAGRRILKETKRFSNEEASRIYSLVAKYENYGDVMIGGFRPSFALEMICGKSTFVVNYCPESHAVNISSLRVDADCVAYQWSMVVKASPELRELFALNK